MKVYLTEQQLTSLICEEALMESIFHKGMSFSEIVAAVKKLGMKGLLTASIIMNIVLMFGLTREQAKVLEDAAKIEQRIEDRKACNFNSETGSWEKNPEAWEEVSKDALATVYNSVPGQCNKDVVHTASMFKLNLNNVLSQRVIAMERTYMKELGLKYGDVVYIEGTGKWDGPWQIQDTMNKRFAGMHKIDILVPRNIRSGKWNGVKISVPTSDKFKEDAKSMMAPSV
jgi:uncharacterized cupin superfamily protein